MCSSHLIATHVGIEKSLAKWVFHVFHTQLFSDIYGNQLAVASSYACIRSLKIVPFVQNTKAFWYKLVIDIDWDDVFESLMEFKSFPHDPECAHDLQKITYILNVFCVGFDEIWVCSGGTKQTWADLGLEKHVRHISHLHKQLLYPHSFFNSQLALKQRGCMQAM